MAGANLFPANFSEEYVDIYGYRLPRAAHFPAQGSGTVGVRPEAITLSNHGEESQRCVIRHVAYMAAIVSGVNLEQDILQRMQFCPKVDRPALVSL